MKYTTVFFGCLLSMSYVGSASAVEKTALPIGLGAASCGKYVEMSKHAEGEIAFTSWTQGFLSGSQMAFRGSYLSMPDTDAIKVYMHNYCQANPLDSYGAGAALLVSELIKKQFGTH